MRGRESLAAGCIGIAALLAVAGMAGPASAQSTDGPLLAPNHDVGVLYRLGGAMRVHGAEKLQASYVDGARRTRLDYFRWSEAKYAFDARIFDRESKREFEIRPEVAAYVDRPIDKQPNPGLFLTRDMSFTRLGTETVAGTACTDWGITVQGMPRGGACVTDDGVLLRLTSADGVALMTATLVAYGKAPDSAFVPPDGYTRLNRPFPGG